MPKIGLVIAIFLSLLISGCATHGPDHYRASGVYQTFDFSRADSYRNYQKALRKMLDDNWQDLFAGDENYAGQDAARVSAIVDSLMPTDADPENCPDDNYRKRSMLLVHGLYDSPYVMHDLEEFFRENCFHTRSLLLPGHGTRAGNLLGIDRAEWIKAVEFGVRSLSKEIGGDIFITGFSTGGALALRQAFTNPDSVQGLFLFAPAIQVPGQWSQIFFDGLGLNWVPFQKLADDDFAKYESATLDAVIEVSKLGKEVQRLLRKRDRLNIPVMVVAAKNDFSIETAVTRQLFKEGKFGNKSQMIIYAPKNESGNCDGDLTDPAAARSEALVVLNSCFEHTMAGETYRIADYSHMSLTLDPKDPHYGLAGNYGYCHHYFLYLGSAGDRKTCRTAERNKVCFGERRMIGAERYAYCKQNDLLVRRLTSNPKFEQLEQRMSDFLEQHSPLKTEH